MTSRSEEIRSEPEKKGFISRRGGRGDLLAGRTAGRAAILVVIDFSSQHALPQQRRPRGWGLARVARPFARSPLRRRALLRSRRALAAALVAAPIPPRVSRVMGDAGGASRSPGAFLAFVGADLGTIHPLGIPASPASPTPLPSPPEDEWTVVAKKSRRKMNAACTRAPPEPARDHARSPLPSPGPNA